MRSPATSSTQYPARGQGSGTASRILAAARRPPPRDSGANATPLERNVVSPASAVLRTSRAAQAGSPAADNRTDNETTLVRGEPEDLQCVVDAAEVLGEGAHDLPRARRVGRPSYTRIGRGR